MVPPTHPTFGKCAGETGGWTKGVKKEKPPPTEVETPKRERSFLPPRRQSVHAAVENWRPSQISFVNIGLSQLTLMPM